MHDIVKNITNVEDIAVLMELLAIKLQDLQKTTDCKVFTIEEPEFQAGDWVLLLDSQAVAVAISTQSVYELVEINDDGSIKLDCASLNMDLVTFSKVNKPDFYPLDEFRSLSPYSRRLVIDSLQSAS